MASSHLWLWVRNGLEEGWMDVLTPTMFFVMYFGWG